MSSHAKRGRAGLAKRCRIKHQLLAAMAVSFRNLRPISATAQGRHLARQDELILPWATGLESLVVPDRVSE